MSSRLVGRVPGLPAGALLFCRVNPLELEETEEVLLTAEERLRMGGALLPLCCSPGGLKGKERVD